MRLLRALRSNKGITMKANRYALWNTETQCDEAYQYMSKVDAEQRNADLRHLGEPYRWVPDFNHTPRVVPDWNA